MPMANAKTSGEVFAGLLAMVRGPIQKNGGLNLSQRRPQERSSARDPCGSDLQIAIFPVRWINVPASEEIAIWRSLLRRGSQGARVWCLPRAQPVRDRVRRGDALGER